MRFSALLAATGDVCEEFEAYYTKTAEAMTRHNLDGTVEALDAIVNVRVYGGRALNHHSPSRQLHGHPIREGCP